MASSTRLRAEESNCVMRCECVVRVRVSVVRALLLVVLRGFLCGFLRRPRDDMVCTRACVMCVCVMCVCACVMCV